MWRKHWSLVVAMGIAAAASPCPGEANQPWGIQKSRLGFVKDSRSLLADKVVDEREKSLGKADDFLVDVSSGRVLYVLLPAKRGQWTPLPAGCVNLVAGKRVKLGVARTLVGSAPTISQAEWRQQFSRNAQADTIRHFAQESTLQAVSGPLMLASEIEGSPLVASRNEPLGVVKSVMLDLTDGTVVYLVVEPLGATDYYVVPPVVVRSMPGKLVLQASQSHFLAGPHFDKSFWTDVVLPELCEKTGKHYGLALEPASTTTASAGGPRTDAEIAREVMREIVRESNGMPEVNILVTAARGHVTLAGKIRNEQAKSRIMAAASRVVGTENVIDQLSR